MGIKHSFVSAVADAASATKVRPTNWNSDHIIDGDVNFNGFSALNLGNTITSSGAGAVAVDHVADTTTTTGTGNITLSGSPPTGFQGFNNDHILITDSFPILISNDTGSEWEISTAAFVDDNLARGASSFVEGNNPWFDGTDTNASVAGQADPDGGTSARSLVESGTNSTHDWATMFNFNGTLDSGMSFNTNYTLSFYIKPGLRTEFALGIYGWLSAANNFFINFNTNTPAITSTSNSGTCTLVSSSIAAASAGFYRLQATFQFTDQSDIDCQLIFIKTPAISTYVGTNGGTACTVYGLKVELGSTATAFTPGSDVLQRLYALDSSNSGNLVNFSAGTKSVLLTTTGNKTHVYDEVNVKDFGAVGDGVTDDTVALQAAMDYAFALYEAAEVNTLKNKVLYIPPGHYIVSSLLYVANAHGIIMKGAGRFTSKITGTQLAAPTIYIEGCSNGMFQDFTVEAATACTSPCFQFDAVVGSIYSNTFLNMGFGGGAEGLRLETSQVSENIIINPTFINHTSFGLRINSANALNNTVIGGNFSACDIGIRANSGNGSVILGVGFQTNTTWDIQLSNDHGHEGCLVSGCRSESTNFCNIDRKCCTITACGQTQASAGTFFKAGAQGSGVIQSCNSLNGQIDINSPGFVVMSTEIGRDDAFVSHNVPLKVMHCRIGLSRENEGTGTATELPLGYVISAVYYEDPGTYKRLTTWSASGDLAAFTQSGTTEERSSVAQARFSNDINPPRLFFGKGRATSVGTYTVVQSADILGELDFEGADGTDFARGASIRATVDGTPGANDMPGKVIIATSPDGSGTVSDRWSVNAVGTLKAETGGGAVQLQTVAFSGVPAAPAAGMMIYVTDSTTTTWGATITGTGGNKVLAWYNGTNWTVAGI